MNTSVARYALGVGSLLLICTSLGAAGVALRRRYFADWSGAIARLSEILIALALFVGMLELLGTVGLFRLAPIVIVCTLAGAIGVRALVLGRTGVAWRRPAASTFAVAVPGVLVLAILAAEWASPTLQSYDVGVHTFDSLWYHMPWAATIAQSGHITPLHYDIEFLLAFYPATTELLHALGIVLFARDTLSPALNLLWLGCALLAAWCVGRSRGRGRLSLLGVAVVLAAPMMVFSQPGSADGDTLGVFLLLGSAAVLLEADGRAEGYVLAAVAAGLAISVKLTFLAPVAALSIGVVVGARPRTRRHVAGLWMLPLLLAGGFWYLRNLIAVGNPLPWSSFGVLPTPSPPIEQHVTFSVAHYLFSANFWQHFFVRGMAAQLGGWWWLICILAVLGPLLVLISHSGRTPRMLAAVALVSLAAYVVTPNSAMGPAGDPIGFTFNLRFAAPGLALALAVLPLAGALDDHRRQVTIAVVLGAVLVVTLTQAQLWPARHLAGAVGLGAALLIGALGLLWLYSRLALRAATFAALAVALAVGAEAGYAWQRNYLRGRYQYRPHSSYVAPLWAMFRDVRGTRIGIVGSYGDFFQYPLFGGDTSNRVRYIAARGPHGSFTPIATCRAWRTAVNRGHFRYLVTTPRRNFWTPRRLEPSPEGRWTLSDPAARLIYQRRVTGQRIAVFALSGPLNPAGCD